MGKKSIYLLRRQNGPKPLTLVWTESTTWREKNTHELLRPLFCYTWSLFKLLPNSTYFLHSNEEINMRHWDTGIIMIAFSFHLSWWVTNAILHCWPNLFCIKPKVLLNFTGCSLKEHTSYLFSKTSKLLLIGPVYIFLCQKPKL